MAHGADIQREARRRYVADRQSLPIIALAIGVSESTVARWKRTARSTGDNWDAARAAGTVAGDGLDTLIADLIQDYVIQHQAAIDALKDAKDMEPAERAQILASLADALSKTVSSAGRLSPKLSKLGVAMDVLKLMGDFVTRHYPHHAPALLEILEPFGAKLAELYK
jgi:transposase-like protein